MAKRRVGGKSHVIESFAGVRAPRGGVTRQGVLLTDFSHFLIVNKSSLSLDLSPPPPTFIRCLSINPPPPFLPPPLFLLLPPLLPPSLPSLPPQILPSLLGGIWNLSGTYMLKRQCSSLQCWRHSTLMPRLAAAATATARMSPAYLASNPHHAPWATIRARYTTTLHHYVTDYPLCGLLHSRPGPVRWESAIFGSPQIAGAGNTVESTHMIQRTIRSAAEPSGQRKTPAHDRLHHELWAQGESGGGRLQSLACARGP
jgi:hypothetical protein